MYSCVLHLASRHPKPTAHPLPPPPQAAGPFWTSPEGPNMSSAARDLLRCQTPLIVSGTAAAVRCRHHHSERRWDIKTSFPLGAGVEETVEDMVAAHLLIKTSLVLLSLQYSFGSVTHITALLSLRITTQLRREAKWCIIFSWYK